jgi:hypothetical protein
MAIWNLGSFSRCNAGFRKTGQGGADCGPSASGSLSFGFLQRRVSVSATEEIGLLVACLERFAKYDIGYVDTEPFSYIVSDLLKQSALQFPICKITPLAKND